MKKNRGILYFMGIGGIGMSALARYFKQQDYKIYGYDLHATPLTHTLEQEGMHIHYTADIALIPDGLEKVIYTPAVPRTNLEFQYFLAAGIPMLKRAEVLGEISRTLTTLAVAGTHGKTSITAMIAHILRAADYDFATFIGGISRDLDNNFFISPEPRFLVVEADEYDRSLLQLSPDRAIITSMDADHLDVYADLNDLQNTFKQFAQKIESDGVLFYHAKLHGFEDVKVPKHSYGLTENAEYTGKNIRIESGYFCFELWHTGQFLVNIEMQVPGRHYVENAIGAAAMAMSVGVEIQTIKKALESFKGVKRRFDIRIKEPDCVYIDDYAHHPEELRNTLEATRALYPDKKICAVFQPHLYSRTRDFAEDFAKVLSMADCLVLLDIYPAREEPVPGVTSRLIFDEVKNNDKYLLGKAELLQFLYDKKPEVVLSLGAGDIGLMVKDIEEILKQR